MATKGIADCDRLRSELVAALTRLRSGDFTVRMDMKGGDPRDREIADLFNEVVDLNDSITGEFKRVARIVGKEGEITHRARVKGVAPIP